MNVAVRLLIKFYLFPIRFTSMIIDYSLITNDCIAYKIIKYFLLNIIQNKW